MVLAARQGTMERLRADALFFAPPAGQICLLDLPPCTRVGAHQRVRPDNGQTAAKDAASGLPLRMYTRFAILPGWNAMTRRSVSSSAFSCTSLEMRRGYDQVSSSF